MRRAIVVAVAMIVALCALTLVTACSQEAGALIGPEEALEMVDRGEAVIVDVRSGIEYEEAHIAGAIASSFFDLDADEVARLRTYGLTVITYCACPAEETSSAAAQIMIENGFEDVLVLKGGLREWVDLGYPIGFGIDP
jgi:rhodanese-related sulfurtransferase